MTEPLTITDAAPLIRSGELTPSELLEQCLARIDIYEPAVKAWVYLDRERARRDAARLTDGVKRGQYRGSLHGIPVGIKDIIDVFDMPTGCGSKLWANSFARRDATCVERLRQAGAVILGKTVTTPFAYLDPPVTRNPWNLDRTPGGSSSGSAAAVACGMVLAALGTQTGGSLTRPASYCGVCSLKPTYCRVSVNGVLPLAPRLDHVGVIANCVRDLAIVFETIAGDDEGWGNFLDWLIPDCIHTINTRGLQASFAVVRGVFEDSATPEMRSGMMDFRRKGDEHQFRIKFREVIPPTSFAHIHRWHRTLMAVGAAGVHAERLERVSGDYPAKISALVEDGLRRSASEYNEASIRQDDIQGEMERTLRYPLWLTPATTGTAPGFETTGDPVMNSPWSFLQVPTVSVPVARDVDGLPIAVQMIGQRRSEAVLLAAATNCETVAAYDRRLPPVPA